MITDVLKTSGTLPVHNTGGREPSSRNDGNEYRNDFIAVLAQVTGYEEKGMDTKTLEKPAHDRGSEQARSSQNTEAPRDTAEEAHPMQAEREASKDTSAKGDVGHKAGGMNREISSSVRLTGLANKLAEMTARYKVFNLKPNVEISSVLTVNDEKMEKQKGNTTAVQNLHRAALRRKLVKPAACRVAVKEPADSEMKPLAVLYEEKKTLQPVKKTGADLRSLKMKSLRNMSQSSDERTSADKYGTAVNLKYEPRESFAGKVRAGGERLLETALSKYEGSIKTVDVKSYYQNIQNADGNFDEIVRQFTLLMRKGGGEAKLLLQPEHLGSLKLRIQLDRGEVATSIVVDNQAVKDLILSRLNILEESLLEHGFGLGSFEVGVKGENGDGETASGTARGSTGGGNQGEAPLAEDELVADYVAAQLPWMSTRVNITV
jgi:flagellar hook-length control protein FliK